MCKHCRICNSVLADSNTSGLCRSCSQIAASEKRKETCRIRYGVDNVMQCKQFVDKIANTMLERYGVNCAMKVPKFREKFKDTMIKLYGVPYYVMTDEYLNNAHFRVSSENRSIGKLIEAQGFRVEYEHTIEDKIYDLLLPDINTVIEVDPSYTHNVIGNHWTKTGIQEDYHKMKTAIAHENGYRCIHIFDWDDVNKIVNMLKPRSKIYARKCNLEEINKKICDEFLNKHHLQGSTRSSILRLGLYYNEELVQVITFGRPRYNKNYEYELLRLCTKPEVQVIGGATKLYKHALDLLKSNSIISYCDIAKFDGSVYERLEMKLLRINSPQEVWSKGTNKILGTTLRSLGYDKLFNTNYGKGTSNEELMIKDGWLPVYDCGQAVYVSEMNNADNSNSMNISIDRDYNQLTEMTKKSKERKCEFCGESFIPASNRQRYCKRPHRRICPVCGKEYLEDNVENLKRPPVACSYECRVKRTQQTSLERYGCKVPGNNGKARKKAKLTWEARRKK